MRLGSRPDSECTFFYFSLEHYHFHLALAQWFSYFGIFKSIHNFMIFKKGNLIDYKHINTLLCMFVQRNSINFIPREKVLNIHNCMFLQEYIHARG